MISLSIISSLTPNFINSILILNGIYDLFCSFSILFLSNPFSTLHLNMFNSSFHIPIINRLLAYWILTYGSIRLISGIYPSNITYFISANTYLIEAFCYEYELFINNSMIKNKIRFVSISSLFLFFLL